MILTWVNHKIAMALVSQFKKSVEKKGESFLTLANSEFEMEEAYNESKVICPVVIKGLLYAEKIDVVIPREVKQILDEFAELVSELTTWYQ